MTILQSDYDWKHQFEEYLKHPLKSPLINETLIEIDQIPKDLLAPESFLVRTYLATKDYILPTPVMQPLWQSVQRADGQGIDFGLNFHRAFYHPMYDNYHDIYLQRVRMEDRDWEVVCWKAATYVQLAKKVQILLPGGEKLVFNGPIPEGLECERRVVVGQGKPPVQSRFKNPNHAENNAWWAASIPKHLQKVTWNESYHMWDGNVTRKADNPPHPSIPDQLTDEWRIVQSR